MEQKLSQKLNKKFNPAGNLDRQIYMIYKSIIFFKYKFSYLILIVALPWVIEANNNNSTPVIIKSKADDPENQVDELKNNQIDFFGDLYLLNNNNLLANNVINEKESSVWVIFQNDCKACHKMMVESKCLKEKSKFKNYFIGIQSSPEIMAKSIKKYIQLDQVLYSKGDLVEKLKIDVTPTVYIFNNSKLVKKIENYVNCRELKKYIDVFSNS